MRSVFLYFFILLNGFGFAQSYQQNLIESNSFLFKNKLFVYGYEQKKEDLNFRCFSFNQQLQPIDSITLIFKKHKASDFLEISTDTLHSLINFYFQFTSKNNELMLLRLNDSLRKICQWEGSEANRINSFTAFDSEKYHYKNDLFVIKTTTDSVAKQFYLNKYHVKSFLKPYEYEMDWQFAFERENIHRASIVYADNNNVFINATIDNGTKKGQWILNINAKNGTLKKGTRLGSKLVNKHYLYSNSVYDLKSKILYVVGSVYDFDMIDFKNSKSNFINLSKRHQLFLVAIDSIGDIISKTEKNIALPIQTNFGMFTNSFHLKIRKMEIKDETSFELSTDIYEQTKPNTFAYYTSWHFKVTPNEIDYDITPSKMIVSTKILPKLISLNDADSYGKFFLNSIGDYDEFKYKQPLNSILIYSGFDDLKNPTFVLKKTDILKGTKEYYYRYSDKKGFEQKTLLTTIKDQKANLYFIKSNVYISFVSINNNTAFELKINHL